MARKWKLRYGLQVCNVSVERDGREIPVKVEAGRIYEGDEFAKWCPAVMVEVPDVKIESLKVPEQPTSPPVLRVPLRPEIRPTEARKVAVDLQATMAKRHIETPPPPPPPPPPEKSEPEPSKEPPPGPPKPEPKNGMRTIPRGPKIKKRGGK